MNNSQILNSEQKRLLLDTTVERLKVYSLGEKVSSIRIVAGSPATEFEGDEKTIIVFHIKSCYFSKPNIKFIICHEIQHRIDELSTKFGYDKRKKETLGQQFDKNYKHFSTILAHLWDVYINGRLDKQGLYQTDSNEAIGIKGQFYKSTPCINRWADIHFLECRGFQAAKQVYDKVWNSKEFELTYDQLVDLAKTGLGISKISTQSI